MLLVRRLVLVVALAVLVSATAYGAGWASKQDDRPAATAAPSTVPDRPVPDRPVPDRPEPVRVPVADPEPAPEPAPSRARTLLGPGDTGPRVRDLQARLAQLDWFRAVPTGTYGELTAEAVRGFQAKRGIPVSGEVDRRTSDRLLAMTTAPTRAELTGVENLPGALDERCLSGRVVCVDKSSNTLRWVVDGEVRQTLDTRFGGAETPTREGVFEVYLKSRDHVSRLYGSSMPFAMFFSGGQAVHYSPDFAAVGYAGASHGCVNVRDRDGVARLFERVSVGDTVVVYRS